MQESKTLIYHQIKKPVILIGALNGSGKTTFLQAVDFVLYGKQSNIFQSSKLSYENFLKKISIKKIMKKELKLS